MTLQKDLMTTWIETLKWIMVGSSLTYYSYYYFEFTHCITKALHREDQGSYQDGDDEHQGKGRQYEPPLKSRPLVPPWHLRNKVIIFSVSWWTENLPSLFSFSWLFLLLEICENVLLVYRAFLMCKDLTLHRNCFYIFAGSGNCWRGLYHCLD